MLKLLLLVLVISLLSNVQCTIFDINPPNIFYNFNDVNKNIATNKLEESDNDAMSGNILNFNKLVNPFSLINTLESGIKPILADADKSHELNKFSNDFGSSKVFDKPLNTDSLSMPIYNEGRPLNNLQGNTLFDELFSDDRAQQSIELPYDKLENDLRYVPNNVKDNQILPRMPMLPSSLLQIFPLLGHLTKPQQRNDMSKDHHIVKRVLDVNPIESFDEITGEALIPDNYEAAAVDKKNIELAGLQSMSKTLLTLFKNMPKYSASPLQVDLKAHFRQNEFNLEFHADNK